MSRNKFLLLLQPLLWIQLLFIDLGWARFDYISSENEAPYITTQVRQGEGLAQIVRELGVEPDWGNQSWIQKIKEANGDLVDGGNFILSANKIIKIPLKALSGLKNYDTLTAKFKSRPLSPKVAVSAPQIPMTSDLAMTAEDAPISRPILKEELSSSPLTNQETLKLEDANPWNPKAHFDLAFGSGYNSLTATSSQQVDTNLTTASGFFATTNLSFNLSERQRVSFYVSPYYSTYTEPENISLQQDNQWLYNLGATYGLRIGRATYLSLLWQSQTRHFARFNFTNVEILAPWIHGAGIELAGEMLHFSSSDIWYYFTPKYLFPSSEDLDIEAGLEASLRFQLQPHSTENGYLIGASYTFHSQKYPGVTQDTHTVLGYVGYRL